MIPAESSQCGAGNAGDTVAVRCRNLVRDYRTSGDPVHALRSVGLTARRGMVTALSGPSGSGKSTLLRIIACVERPERGTVEINGVDATRLSARKRRALRRTDVGFVYQDPADNLLGYLTIAEHIALGARLRGTAASGDDLIATLGLEDKLEQHPRELSGGEQQRAALAFAASGDPALLVADEPTAQLDHASTARVVLGLQQLAKRGHSVIVATHDPEISSAADVLIELVDGRTTQEAV